MSGRPVRVVHSVGNEPDLYKMYTQGMADVTLSEFRKNQSHYVALAQREPVEILSRGKARRAVLVSADFFDRAYAALEDIMDMREAAKARQEPGPRVSHEELLAELGLDES